MDPSCETVLIDGMTHGCVVEEDHIQYDSQEPYKADFLVNIDEIIAPANEKKAEMIKEYVGKLKCLKCFDVQRLIKKRKYLPFSSLDFRGTYNVILCDNCDSGKVLYPTHELCEKLGKKRIRYARYTPFDDLATSVYHIALENEISIPDWEFVEDHSTSQKMTQINIDGDVKQVVSTIESMVKSYFADPSALANLLENIHVQITHFCTNSKSKKEICRWIETEKSFFVFDLEKDTTKIKGGCMNMSYSTQVDTLKINLLCVKPKNKAAEQMCISMMDTKAKTHMMGFMKRTEPMAEPIRRISRGPSTTLHP